MSPLVDVLPLHVLSQQFPTMGKQQGFSVGQVSKVGRMCGRPFGGDEAPDNGNPSGPTLLAMGAPAEHGRAGYRRGRPLSRPSDADNRGILTDEDDGVVCVDPPPDD